MRVCTWEGNGSPVSLAKMLCFVPIFLSVGWIMSHWLLGQRRLYHTAINALPFLKIPVNTTTAPMLSRYCFPLILGSQNIENTLQHLPNSQIWPFLAQGFLVLPVRVYLLFWNILFYFSPQLIWYCLGLCPFFLFHFISSGYYISLLLICR